MTTIAITTRWWILSLIVNNKDVVINHHVTIIEHTPTCMHSQTHSNTLGKKRVYFRCSLLKTIILNFKTSVMFYIANSDCTLFCWNFILWEDIDRYLNNSFSLLLVSNFPHKTRYRTLKSRQTNWWKGQTNLTR